MLFFMLILRILANPSANVFQKKLASNFSTFFINAITYGGLVCIFLPFILRADLVSLNQEVWFYGILGGLAGSLGNAFLVKALSLGDLSVLGPINSYKSVVAMIFGIILLGEIPSLTGILATALIIWGSYFVFDTTAEKFSLSLFRRKDIIFRFLALFFTGFEAIMIKRVILLSDINISFFFWCCFGFLFSLPFAFRKKISVHQFNKKSILYFAGLILMFGLMQYSTNYVFQNMNVSYALALFQLSSLINVIFGCKFFNETQIRKKIFGTLIMIIGSVIIILV